MPQLHRAAYCGELEEVQRLIKAGAIANELFDTGLVDGYVGNCPTSPLAIAVWKGNLDIAELLAKKMANSEVSSF